MNVSVDEPRSVWGRFTQVNKRICKEFLQPRLYTVTHMSAAEWWFLTHTSSLDVRERLLEFGCGREFPVSKLCGRYFDRCDATDIENVAEWCPSGVDFTQSRLPCPMSQTASMLSSSRV